MKAVPVLLCLALAQGIGASIFKHRLIDNVDFQQLKHIDIFQRQHRNQPLDNQWYLPHLFHQHPEQHNTHQQEEKHDQEHDQPQSSQRQNLEIDQTREPQSKEQSQNSKEHQYYEQSSYDMNHRQQLEDQMRKQYPSHKQQQNSQEKQPTHPHLISYSSESSQSSHESQERSQKNDNAKKNLNDEIHRWIPEGSAMGLEDQMRKQLPALKQQQHPQQNQPTHRHLNSHSSESSQSSHESQERSQKNDNAKKNLNDEIRRRIPQGSAMSLEDQTQQQHPQQNQPTHRHLNSHSSESSQSSHESQERSQKNDNAKKNLNDEIRRRIPDGSAMSLEDQMRKQLPAIKQQQHPQQNQPTHRNLNSHSSESSQSSHESQERSQKNDNAKKNLNDEIRRRIPQGSAMSLEDQTQQQHPQQNQPTHRRLNSHSSESSQSSHESQERSQKNDNAKKNLNDEIRRRIPDGSAMSLEDQMRKQLSAHKQQQHPQQNQPTHRNLNSHSSESSQSSHESQERSQKNDNAKKNLNDEIRRRIPQGSAMSLEDQTQQQHPQQNQPTHRRLNSHSSESSQSSHESQERSQKNDNAKKNLNDEIRRRIPDGSAMSLEDQMRKQLSAHKQQQHPQQNQPTHPHLISYSSESSQSSHESQERSQYNDNAKKNLNDEIHRWIPQGSAMSLEDQNIASNDVIERKVDMNVSSRISVQDKEELEKIFSDAQKAMNQLSEKEQMQFHQALEHANQHNQGAVANATQLAQKHQYHIEEHIVKTDDGYILTLFRITPKIQSRLVFFKKPVVFLMHGIDGSADDWLLMGPKKSLAYLLFDAGYDVWLGNARGNKYSKKHVSMHPAISDFWQYSIDEIALHDLPAMIDYALETSKQKKLFYIGHSQGNTAFFALNAARPEYSEKIIMMYALSPIVYMKNARSPLLRMISPLSNFYNRLQHQLGNGPFSPNKEFIRAVGGAMLEAQIGCKDVSSNINFVMAGVNVSASDAHIISLVMHHLPAGTSSKLIKHYGQAIASQEFRRYDYGPEVNMNVYGKEQPPRYEMEKVKAPVSLYYSEEDWLAHPKDVERLEKELPNVRESIKLSEEHFGNMDFQFSSRAPEMVYKSLIESMQKNY